MTTKACSKVVFFIAVATIAATPITGFAAEQAKHETAAPKSAFIMKGHPQMHHTPAAIAKPFKTMPSPQHDTALTGHRDGFAWVPGDYAWVGDNWLWNDGYWLAQPWADAVWVAGYWVNRPYAYTWVPGHWM